MKTKIVVIITGVISLCVMIVGLIFKSSYKDFNQQDNALDNFVVGIMTDELADVQIAKMYSELDNCNVIIAAECIEEPFFRFGCITEKVVIRDIFKGDNLEVGEEINIGRSSSCIFWEEEMLVNEMPTINMGFVRAMQPGKTYLIFLADEKDMEGKERLYIQPARFLISPIFCYEETDSVPYESIDSKGNYNEYKIAKDSEFFLSSEKSIEKIYELKKTLLSKYICK